MSGPSKLFSQWWHYLKYSPSDPQFYVKHAPRIVAIGGGTGLSVLLQGLKEYTPFITAVVAVTDDGRSSGRLRRDYKVIPPGDIRQCLMALSPEEELLSRLLNYRFPGGKGLKGHAFGNLLMVALAQIEGGMDQAIVALSQLLRIDGAVLPVTLEQVELMATHRSGKITKGEIDTVCVGHKDPITKVALSHPAKAYPQVLSAILEADLIVIGPGSLYTSIAPPLLVKGVKEAIQQTKASCLYICNISTERGETEGYGVADHLKVVAATLGKEQVDGCVVNTEITTKTDPKDQRLGAIHHITTSLHQIDHIPVLKEQLVDVKHPLYHNSALLAQAIMRAYTKVKPPKRVVWPSH